MTAGIKLVTQAQEQEVACSIPCSRWVPLVDYDAFRACALRLGVTGPWPYAIWTVSNLEGALAAFHFDEASQSWSWWFTEDPDASTMTEEERGFLATLNPPIVRVGEGFADVLCGAGRRLGVTNDGELVASEEAKGAGAAMGILGVLGLLGLLGIAMGKKL